MAFRYAQVLLAALMIAFASGPSAIWGQARSYPPEFADARAEVYKRIDQTELKLWVFEPPDHSPGRSRPAIVFFFGGGWKSGTPAQFEQHCRYLAGQGVVSMLADYRVRDRHEVLADRCVADAKSAIRYVRRHAERLGVDPDRVVAAGGSAGGHLAACTALIPGLDEPTESLEVSSVPDALALFNPALVLAPFDGVEIDSEKRMDLASRTGVPPKQISPIHHLRRGLPPTIIFHGEADTTVGFDTVRRYAELSQELGNRCELVGYPGAAHGFFNYGRGGGPGEHYLDTLDRLHRFLVSLGYLQTPPDRLLPKSSNVHLRSLMANSLAAIKDRKQATIAFIGGSITEMNGYRPMMERWFQDSFPETEFEFVDAGISSTCSTTGAFRLSRDVLAHHPDLILIEFAVNDDQDAAHSHQACVRGMEGIIRHALQDKPQVDLVVTYFINPPMLELLSKGDVPISVAAHDQVAAHYGVSSVHLAKEVAERIEQGRLTWEQYGGTHPADAGNRIAAEMVQDLLATSWSLPETGAVKVVAEAKGRLPKKLDERSYDAGRFLDLASAELGAQWRLGAPAWEEIPGALRPRFAGRDLLCASQPGAELRLSFRGSAIGLYVLAGPDAGQVEFTIDGGEPEVRDLYHRFSKGLHYPRTVVLRDDLPPGPHELVLRVGSRGDREEGGTAVRIVAFAAN